MPDRDIGTGRYLPIFNPEEHFWSLVQKTPTCWIWTLATDKKGYGRFWVASSGKTEMAHRVAYEFVNGKILEGLQIDHLCKNTRCVNPSHLEAVTSRENNLRSNCNSTKNHRKTHCPRGHLLAEPNLVKYRLERGMRECRSCAVEYTRQWRLKAVNVVPS